MSALWSLGASPRPLLSSQPEPPSSTSSEKGESSDSLTPFPQTCPELGLPAVTPALPRPPLTFLPASDTYAGWAAPRFDYETIPWGREKDQVRVNWGPGEEALARTGFPVRQPRAGRTLQGLGCRHTSRQLDFSPLPPAESGSSLQGLDGDDVAFFQQGCLIYMKA